jgi:hypothetical protein
MQSSYPDIRGINRILADADGKRARKLNRRCSEVETFSVQMTEGDAGIG